MYVPVVFASRNGKEFLIVLELLRFADKNATLDKYIKKHFKLILGRIRTRTIDLKAMVVKYDDGTEGMHLVAPKPNNEYYHVFKMTNRYQDYVIPPNIKLAKEAYNDEETKTLLNNEYIESNDKHINPNP
jgi:hypothetical protein